MPTATSPMGARHRQRLARQSTTVGQGTFVSRLYNLGAFPGLVETDPVSVLQASTSDRASDAPRVHGFVVQLWQPDSVWTWLDPYEDAEPDCQTPLYERVIRTVHLEAGTPSACWVYLYRGPLTDAQPIPGGHWPA